MQFGRPSRGVFCPMCGKPAKRLSCIICSSPGKTSRRLVSPVQCPKCKGTGTVIHCEACTTRRRIAAVTSHAEREALKRNPFLPYYDKRFRKYRK